MIADSRAGSSFRLASRCLISCFHSGTFALRPRFLVRFNCPSRPIENRQRLVYLLARVVKVRRNPQLACALSNEDFPGAKFFVNRVVPLLTLVRDEHER